MTTRRVRRPCHPHGLQHLLSHSRWDADGLPDDLQAYVVGQLDQTGAVLIIDDAGFVKKSSTSAGAQRQYSGTAGLGGVASWLGPSVSTSV
ncbi:transposase [Streptomyces sp. NPDC002205]|uniref:transposase n=1 Tax=Streptomyces sp. NPDC002205 TaxID=3154411 RepID=UPI00332D37CB